MARDLDGMRQELWRLAQLAESDQRFDASRDEALAAAQAAMTALIRSHREEDLPWHWFERLWALGALLLYMWSRRRRLCRRWRRRRQQAQLEAGEEEMAAGPAVEGHVAVAADPIQQAAAEAPVEGRQVLGWRASLMGWLRGLQPAPAAPAAANDSPV